MRNHTILFALTPILLSCQKADRPSPPPEIITTKLGTEMVVIPAGSFEMGSPDGNPDEQPVHQVWIDSFVMDRYEVTQKQYAKLILADPAHFKGPTRPVEMISWANAALYCNKRSRAEGLEPCYDEETAQCDFAASGYRLPTEAEWEYACRAGSATRELKRYAWFAENASKTTHPVGLKQPNPWGLYDILGNVAEWCNDIYGDRYYAASPEKNPRGPTEGDKYVLRGGAWNSSPRTCRPAHRVGEAPGFQDACFARDAIGFRCVRRQPAKTATEPPPSGKTGLAYDPIYLEHKTGAAHPERPERLTAIVDHLEKAGLSAQLVKLKPLPDVLSWITTVHTPAYVQRAKEACEEGKPYFDIPDVPVSARSYDTAVAAVGGVLSAIDAVMAGRIRNAFCAVRPPGHHAFPNRAMGFCIFNNVAIAARYIQKKHTLKKVLIVDWDVHHGNGTQAIFYEDPAVFYFGIHQSPFYPGTGRASERGSGNGEGTTLNVPLAAGSGDAEYVKAFTEQLAPAARAFKPDFLLVSAGFDLLADDLLGGMRVTPSGIAALSSIVKDIAAECAGGRLVSVLEGGYNLKRLAASVEAHVRVLME